MIIDKRSGPAVLLRRIFYITELRLPVSLERLPLAKLDNKQKSKGLSNLRQNNFSFVVSYFPHQLKRLKIKGSFHLMSERTRGGKQLTKEQSMISF